MPETRGWAVALLTGGYAAIAIVAIAMLAVHIIARVVGG